MNYSDKFEPRPFQRELIDVARARHREGKRITVAIVGAGSGKTLGYEAAANMFLRERVIDDQGLAVYVPRTSLAQQSELGYREDDRDLFDSRLRFEEIEHNVNKPPLTHTPRQGFVSTYSALCNKPNIHLQWAKVHAGRFLLVVDEAQFCGCDDADRSVSGTAAAANIEAMAAYAAHTLILTATPKRSDNAQIVLADYRTDAKGDKYIEYHVRATYGDGIEQWYLRPFETRMINAEVSRREIDSGKLNTDLLSDDSRMLGQILKCEEVWQPLVDGVVAELIDAKDQWTGYKALISCMEQGDARKVAAYLRQRYPDLKVAEALSNDGADAHRALKRFRKDNTDILVTVRMAFVGYDCKSITVVGCLTHYRDFGHLEQLFGRGFRVDKQSGIPADQQKCRIIAPDDVSMKKFLTYLKAQRDVAIKPTGNGEGQPTASEYVEAAEATNTHVIGYVRDFDSTELGMLDQLRAAAGVSGAVTNIADLIDKAVAAGYVYQRPTATTSPASPPSLLGADLLTNREQIQKFKSKANTDITSAAKAAGIPPGDPSYQVKIRQFRIDHVLNPLGLRSADELRTVEQARRYAIHCRDLYNHMHAR